MVMAKKPMFIIYNFVYKHQLICANISSLITKGWEYALERIEALKFLGFKKQDLDLVGHNNEKYSNYWLLNKK